MSEPICPRCKQHYPLGYAAALKKRRSESQKAALAMAKSLGEPVGRPIEYDYKRIIELRKQGMSMRKIGSILDCSAATVLRVVQSKGASDE